MQDLAPQPGIEPMSPELQGRFLAPGPQGSPWRFVECWETSLASAN